MKAKKYNRLALIILALFVLLLLLLKNTLLVELQLNYIAIIGFAVILLTVIVGFLLVPTHEKKLFIPKYYGYGISLNPRNLVGLAIYSNLLLVMLQAIIG